MFKVFSKKRITDTLLIILVIIILTVSGIVITDLIKNNFSKPVEQTTSVVQGELV